MTNLYEASNQWASRPADERFWNLSEMYAKTRQSADESVVEEIPMSDVRFRWNDAEVMAEIPDYTEAASLAMGKYGHTSARFTHYSFGQMCRTVEAPSDYLRSLPPATAVECLRHGHKRAVSKGLGDRQFLFQANGSMTVRAQTSDRYERIWNHEIVERLRDFQAHGWRVPPARPASIHDKRTRTATADDIIDFGQSSALNVRVGDTIGPAGLYASDHDMFAFMVDPEVVIDDGSSPHGLRRGFMVRQSEVGDCSLWTTEFLFNTVCGNHIIWGVSNVRDTRLRHVGNISDRWTAVVSEVARLRDSSGAEQEADIRRARAIKLGNTKEDVLDFLFGKRLLSRKVAEQSYDLAEQHADVHGDPRSAWGVAQGLTRLSQDTAHADKRATLDTAAGRILQMVVL